MNEYKIIILRERPELAPIAAEWFHCKWGVPTEAYLECIVIIIKQCITMTMRMGLFRRK